MLNGVQISELTQDQSLDTAFLGTVDPQPSMTAWYITLYVNWHDTQFKINMGAEVTAVSEETYQRLKSPQISTPSKTLYGSSQCPLRTVLRQELCHIKGSQHYRLCLLSVAWRQIRFECLPSHRSHWQPGSIQLKQELANNTTAICFLTCLKGLGNLGAPYDIQLKDTQ